MSVEFTILKLDEHILVKKGKCIYMYMFIKKYHSFVTGRVYHVRLCNRL